MILFGPRNNSKSFIKNWPIQGEITGRTVMDRIILNPSIDYSAQNNPICLQTSLGNHIDNYQVRRLSDFEKREFPNFEKYNVDFRSSPCPVYNCHGLSFAARRTNIDRASDIRKIISDDRYFRVDSKDVLPGDIVLYVDTESGDIPHSGVVVQVAKDLVSPIFVVSKWGKFKEAVHNVTNSPYLNCVHEYYRVNYEEFAG
jgi:hypothetical protein